MCPEPSSRGGIAPCLPLVPVFHPRRRGVAIFAVMGLVLVIGIIAFYVHQYSRRQKQQSFHLSSAEVAFQAAEFGAREGYLYVLRAVDFLNSTDPATLPKQGTIPSSLRGFFDAFVRDDGRLTDKPAETTLPIVLTPVKGLLDSVGSDLTLSVQLRLERQKPLLPDLPLPGVTETLLETRGRFVIDALACFRGVERRVVSVFEQRTIHLQVPVLGRFALFANEVAGTLNQVSTPLQNNLIPPRFAAAGTLKPLVIQGGPPVTSANRAGVLADPSGYLDGAGWVFLGTPQGGEPWQLTLGMAPGSEGDGEHFLLHGERLFVFPITSGGVPFGSPAALPAGWDPLEMWRTHQRYACLTGLYEESRGAGRNQFLGLSTENTQRASLLRLMGTSAEPAPTVVFGKVFRSLILERGLRRIPVSPLSPDGPASATPCPFVPQNGFSAASWPGMSAMSTAAVRQTCRDAWDDYSQGMSIPLVSPINEGLAFFFDTTPLQGANRPLQPTFSGVPLSKIGRKLTYSPSVPQDLVLDGQMNLLRSGAGVFSGEVQQVLPNVGPLLLARCGREFPDADALRVYLNQLRQQGRQATGFYHVKGPFSWTAEWNALAVGGVGIVCDLDLAIRSTVKPSGGAGLPDARQNRVVLATLGGDVEVGTAEPVEAALLAPKGRFHLTGTGGFDLLGCLAVRTLDVGELATNAPKRLRYDPQHDWADAQAYAGSFRIMLEQQPHLFVAKPR